MHRRTTHHRLFRNCIPVMLSLLLGSEALAEDPPTAPRPFARRGLLVGVAGGITLIHTTLPGQTEFKASFPNIKIGWMLNERAALALYLPGSIYTFRAAGRQRDRGVEGIMPSFQYWLTDRWWVLGGAGLALDAPAFYDVKDASEGVYYVGPGAVAATGFEFLRAWRFAMDVQFMVHGGYAYVAGGQRFGVGGNVMLGLNFY
jgi:hypothetical protein